MSDSLAKSVGAGHEGWLGRTASLCLPRPRLTVVVSVFVLIVLGIVALGLPVNTSRYELVDDDDPYQARLLAFFDRFGYPDSLLWVIQGGDAEDRRDMVDRLSARLEQEPELAGKVLGRIGLAQVAELSLLIEPDSLSQLRARLGDDPAELIEGGLDRWLGLIAEQLADGLESDEAVDEAQADEGLRALAKTLRAIDAHLTGGDVMRELPRLVGESELPKAMNVDERGYVVSADGQTHVIGLFAEMPGTGGKELKPVIDRLRRLRDEVTQGSQLTVALTGLPALASDELESVQDGLAVTSIATTAGILLLMLLAFRSLRYTILALLPLGIGLVITLAAVRFTYGSLNLVTSSFISVLLALGIDFGVYVLSRYGELVREGASTRDAIVGSVVKAGPGVAIGAATTIMAFGMTTTTDFTAFGELGVIIGMGLALMLAITFILLPPLVSVAGRGKTIKSPELPGVQLLPAIIRKLRYPLPALALAALALCLAVVGALRFNPRYIDFMPENTESVQALLPIERDQGLTPIQASVPVGDVETTRALADRLRALDVVGAVQTATDVLPPLDEKAIVKLRAGFAGLARDPDFDVLRKRERSPTKTAEQVDEIIDALDEVAFAMRQADRPTAALDELQAAAVTLRDRLRALPDGKLLQEMEERIANLFERAWRTARVVAERGHYLPEDLPQVFQHRFVSRDRRALALYVNPAGNIWDPAVARRFADQVTEVAPDAVGLAVSTHVHNQMIVNGYVRAAMFSAAFVLVILMVGFRRLHDALFAMLPVVLGLGWLLGTMALLDMPFNVVTILVPTLIFGIGIDAGAHMMHRFRESATQNGGVANLDDMIRGTGAAVLMASLTTATGFATLMIAENNGMASLGMSMTMGIGACLIAALFILPAVLVALGKAR